VRDGRAILAEAVEVYREALGDRLVAAYALGSLAHGGFSPLVSDVDLGLVLADPVRASDADAVGEGARVVRDHGGALRQRLSVFWSGLRALREGRATARFPALDRLDLIESGRLLAGRDVRGGLARPDRAELVAAGAEFALDWLGGDAAVEEIRTPQLLFARGPIRLTKVVLFPVRFLFSAQTGLIGTNEAAVTHHLAGSQPVSRELVRAALAWRTAPPDSTVALPLLAGEMMPLYLAYVEDHVSRLAALGRRDLARAFEDWRHRLTG
jgi:predicted nucleotidyltransferase